jgi:ribosomal protein S18 acetylase RimI-like enzyme
MVRGEMRCGPVPGLATLRRVSEPDALAWAPLDDRASDDLAALAADVLAADGGLRVAAHPAFLRSRWRADGVVTLAARDAGRLVAAGAVRPQPAEHGARFTALVHPAHRGRGLGGRLLDWGLAEGARLGAVTVETESLVPAAEALFASRGLRQVFAEDVLRIDLANGVPDPAWPEGTTLREWTAETAPRFFAVYEAAFRDRPGFPGYPAEEWIADVDEDDDVQRQWSVLATVPGAGDAGFVLVEPNRIVQLGVVPAARGAGLGAALVREALRRIRSGGAAEAFLEVNVDNPAGRLYRRLGFTDAGRRARFALPPAG